MRILCGKANKTSPEKKIGVFVDGPNLLRKEFMIDLRELRKRAEKYGRITIAKVFLNQFAPTKLIEAVINEGYEVVMVLGENEEEKNDVDVTLAVHSIEAVLTKNLDYLGLATRDTDFLPVIQKAKEHGVEVVLFTVKKALSSSLKNAADHLEFLENRQKLKKNIYLE